MSKKLESHFYHLILVGHYREVFKDYGVSAQDFHIAGSGTKEEQATLVEALLKFRPDIVCAGIRRLDEAGQWPNWSIEVIEGVKRTAELLSETMDRFRDWADETRK